MVDGEQVEKIDKTEADRDVKAVVQSAVGAVGKAGTLSAGAVSDAAEGAARALARRTITSAVAEPKDVPSEKELARALAARPPGPTLGGATAAALAARAATRFGPFRFFAKKTPMWLVAAAVPAFYASVTRGAYELGLVASHLVHRARAAGIEPDIDAIQRVTAQLVMNKPIDPSKEASYGAIAVRWLRRALRAAMPFTAGVATADPKGLAAAAARVHPAALGKQAA